MLRWFDSCHCETSLQLRIDELTPNDAIPGISKCGRAAPVLLDEIMLYHRDAMLRFDLRCFASNPKEIDDSHLILCFLNRILRVDRTRIPVMLTRILYQAARQFQISDERRDNVLAHDRLADPKVSRMIVGRHIASQSASRCRPYKAFGLSL